MVIEMRPHRDKGLYVITDCGQPDLRTMLDRTGKILEAGVSILQFRDKSDDQSLRRETARALRELCNRTDTVFLINDDVRLAIDACADGVHLGKDDMSYAEARSLLGDGKIIGISCYNDIQAARRAQAEGADYIAFGAFYQTQTKTGTVKAAPELLTTAKAEIFIPIVAIGGINPENGRALVKAGADMLAVISSVYNVDNPGRVVLKYNALFH